ncbi:MAG: bacillithiol biosynthesis deacetylase BshB2 [Nakamurella sp.]
MSRHVLSVHPHPDDEIDKAGSLAQHVDAGDVVTLIAATSGQMGRRMGVPFFANRETLPGLREAELRASCDAIGIEDLRLWRMQDKTVQFNDPRALAGRIEEVIHELDITVIYTFYPGHAVHPDHNAIGEAAVLAAKRQGPARRPCVYGTAFTRERYDVLGQPDVRRDVSDVIDRKMNALRAHRSQSELDMKELDRKLQANPDDTKELLARYLTEELWVCVAPGVPG